MNDKLKKVIIPIVIIIVIILLILPKVDFSKAENQNTKTSSSPTGIEALVVKPQKLQKNIEVTGEIRANESVAVKSEVSGKITGVHFEEGHQVKKGELLITINNDELLAIKKKLEQQIRFWETKKARQQSLYKQEAVSEEAYQETLTELENRKADLQEVKARLAKTYIRAPFAGTIGLRNVSPGEYISPETTIARVVDTHPVKVAFSIPGKYAGIVETGDSISFSPEKQGEQYTGVMYAIESSIDAETRTLAIKAYADNEQNRLFPGQYAKVNVVLQQSKNALMVPAESIIPELRGHKVYIAKNNKAQPVPVKVGTRNPRLVEITHGLQAGDTIVTTGILEMSPGKTVKIDTLRKYGHLKDFD